MKRLFALLLTLTVGAAVHADENFLDQQELDRLTPNPEVAGVSRYVTEGKDPSTYAKLIVGSVSFYFDEKSKIKSIDAEEMKVISDAVKSAFITAASEKREVVLTKAPDALLVNLAVTEVKMQNKKRGLLGYTPIGLVVSTTANLAGLRTQLKDAHIEGEAVDSMTGEVISVFRLDNIDNVDGKKKLSWDDLVGTFQAALTKTISAW